MDFVSIVALAVIVGLMALGYFGADAEIAADYRAAQKALRKARRKA
jgi:hypothetical protein